MTKLEEVRDKLTRTEEQIVKAQEEIESLSGQISDVQDNLTRELGLPDMDSAIVKGLEDQKEALEGQRNRLSARILALQSTLESQELGIAEYELKDAVKQYKKRVEEYDGSLGTYRTQAPELARSLGQMHGLLREKMEAVSDSRDRVAYYSELLGLERPKLTTPDSLTHEEDEQLARLIHTCIPQRPDAWRQSPFGIKLKELNERRREEQRAASVAKSQAESKLAV